ncbi:MAG: 3-deoxy-7-phosphoheptulonate synthase [Bdellovibrionota bacterium]
MEQMTLSNLCATDNTVKLGPLTLGAGNFTVIAGPCAIESEESFNQIALGVKAAGGAALRGGIFKMRTYASTFQGLGREAYEIVKHVRKNTGMPVVAEITDPRQLEEMSDLVDMFQVGTRNMYHYELLKELGRTKFPVLLKRGLSAYLDEWLAAADYIIERGNPNVVFCERGIRTFEKATRNTLDLSAVPYLKTRTKLPVLVDPSHGTGVRELIPPMCYAAAAAGADGLLVEVHTNPEKALSDGFQALDLQSFNNMMSKLKKILAALDKPLQTK